MKKSLLLLLMTFCIYCGKDPMPTSKREVVFISGEEPDKTIGQKLEAIENNYQKLSTRITALDSKITTLSKKDVERCEICDNAVFSEIYLYEHVENDKLAILELSPQNRVYDYILRKINEREYKGIRICEICKDKGIGWLAKRFYSK